jgi:hypothetical protein
MNNSPPDARYSRLGNPATVMSKLARSIGIGPPILLQFNFTRKVEPLPLYCETVFFVLSGFVVSNAAAKRRSSYLPLRYLRLAVPVLCSVFYGWALLKVIPTATTELNRILPHPWLQRTCQGDRSLTGRLASLFEVSRNLIMFSGP